MFNCTHVLRSPRNGRRLRHSDETEAQIHLSLQMPPEDLIAWVRCPSLRHVPIKEEAMAFLIVHHRSSAGGVDPPIINELSASLDDRMRAQITRGYSAMLGGPAAEELANEVTFLGWTLMLGPGARGVWAEVCFNRFLKNLSRDVLRKLREKQTVSLDTDNKARIQALKVAGQGASAEELVYLREMLSQLKPRQREAFILHHVHESHRAIGRTMGRFDRAVRTWLKQAERRLHADC